MFVNKKIFTGMLFFGSLLLASCHKNEVAFNQEDLASPATIFPTPPSRWLPATNGGNYFSSGFIGDVMPYYANDSFQVFYLHDGDGANGYHPIHAFATKDLLHYNYKGRSIPFGADADQDRAVGTGSVVKVANTYYFYYTGHNDLHWGTGKPVEGIMYATSTDLKNWTKKTGFNLLPAAGYEQNDFRDPYVFLNSATNEYWMLVSARKNGKAVLALYTSADPTKDAWTLKDPLYTDNNGYWILECPDLFKMGNYWYLLYSESNVQRTTHYLRSASVNGPWEKPAIDVLDGAFYYAAKSAADAQSRYLFGWTYRKNSFNDYGGNIWGGNLVVHKLLQNPDGTLSTKTPENISNLFSKAQALTPASMLNATASGSAYTMQSDGFVTFDLIKAQRKITTTIKGLQAGADAGFAFAYQRPGNGDYYKLRFRDGIAYLLKVQGANEYVDSQVPFSFTPGSDISVEIIIDNNVLVANINGKTTLTGRSYWLPNAKWGIYSKGAGVTFDQLKLLTF